MIRQYLYIVEKFNGLSSPPDVLVKHWADVPPRAESFHASAETLVVNGSRVDGEEAHQQNQITSSKHHPPDLETETRFTYSQNLGMPHSKCLKLIKTTFRRAMFHWMYVSLG